MTNIALRKIVTSLIGSIMPLAMFAVQDNVAPQAKVSVSDILGIGFEARNLVDGKEVVQDRGVLPLAMRASMAIPGAFAPVRKNGMVLVDGGISNNFPVDLAKAMGADIIIGVDVLAELKDASGLESVTGILDQMTSFLGIQKYEENK